MKFPALKNVTNKRITITQVRGLGFEPGEIKKVHPATASHPAVSRLIGNGLTLVAGEVQKVEPKAPAKPQTQPAEPTPEPVVEPNADTTPEPEETVTPDPTPVVEDDGDLRDKYISAPGITDANVDAVLEAYPTMDALKEATKDALLDCGISKNQTKRLLAWIAEA